MRRSYKYRIYPDRQTKPRIDQTITTCRILYNRLLAQRKDAWEKESKTLSRYDQQKSLRDWKKDNQYLRDVYAQVLIEVAIRLDRSFQAFFRRVKAGEKPGYPRFKGWRFYTSFTYTQSGFKLEGNRLCMSKIGTVKVELHRPIEGKVKTLTISRKNGKYYACFSCQVEQKRTMPLTGRCVGIDLGLTNFLVTSDGHFIPGPKPYRKTEKWIKTLQKSVSRKPKGSNRREKSILILAKAHEKAANQRRDFAFKTAYWLLSEYDVVFHEKLDVKDMVQNGKHAKSIHDAGWTEFVSILKSQGQGMAGKRVVGVDPRNTTQICSRCGRIVEKTLWDRVHKCPGCGLEIDRDLNAAINILNRGLEDLSMSSSAKIPGDRQMEKGMVSLA